LSFASGAGAFFLGGFPIQFNGASNAITQSSASAQSIANDISPNANSIVTLNLTGDGTGIVTMSGAILSGAGGRDYATNKTGASTFILTGAGTYTGGTVVTAGSLFVNNVSGSATGTGSVDVANSGTIFGGSGTVTGNVGVATGASLSPGASGSGSTAILHTGGLTLSSGANFVLDLNNTTAGTGYDRVSAVGAVNISGSSLILNPGAGLAIGDKFFIVANDGSDAVIGTFTQGTTITAGNDTFLINYADNADGGSTANDISLTLIGVVPEVSSAWLIALVPLAAIALRHRQRIARRG
jgi:autotransporter-associated beta strand protein